MFLNESTTPYIPKIALIVYQKDDTQNHFCQATEGPSHYLETADIQNNNGQFQIGSTKPFQIESFFALQEFLTTKKNKERAHFQFEGFIPRNILYAKQEGTNPYIVWYQINVEQKLLFRGPKVPNGKIKLPNLVFKYRNNNLSVFAVKDSNIDSKTELYQAPFHNTQPSGICMGSAKIKIRKRTYENAIRACEDAFYGSYFTHIYGGDPITSSRHLDQIMTECIETGNQFPIEVLRPLNQTVSTLIQ